MSEEIKQITEAIVSHPKTSLAVTTFFTSHVWFNYGEPIVKGVTSMLGLFVLILLAVKHVIDIKKSFQNKDESKDDKA